MPVTAGGVGKQSPSSKEPSHQISVYELFLHIRTRHMWVLDRWDHRRSTFHKGILGVLQSWRKALHPSVHPSDSIPLWVLALDGEANLVFAETAAQKKAQVCRDAADPLLPCPQTAQNYLVLTQGTTSTPLHLLFSDLRVMFRGPIAFIYFYLVTLS